MSAVLALARAEVRRSWRALVVLGVLAGVAGGGVLAGLAGARRTDSAFDRLVARTDYWDIQLMLFDPADGVIDEIRRLPGIAESATGSLSVGRDLQDPDVQSFFPVQSSPESGFVDRIVVEGRAADPAAVDEIVMSQSFAALLGVAVGDVLPWASLSHEQFLRIDQLAQEPAAGPRVDLRVVGLTLDPSNVVFADSPTVLGTPAFLARFRPLLPRVRVIEMALRDGVDPHDLAAAAIALAEARTPAPPGSRFPSASATLLADGRPAIEDATDLPVDGMRTAAAIAGVVALLAIGQAAGRQVAGATAGRSAIRAIGATRRQRWAALSLAGGPSAVVATATSVGVAIAMSSSTPVGAARRAEPDPGRYLDAVVVFPGAIGVGVVVVAAFATAATLAARQASRPAGLHPRPAPVPGWVSLKPVSGIGTRLALDGGGAVPVRSAMAGVAAGVLAVAGGIVFGASLDRLGSDAARWGAPDLVVEAPDEGLLARLTDHDAVQALAVVDSASVEIEGVTVSGLGYEPRVGEVGFTLLEGRPPATDAEVVLGPELLEELSVDVGDIVRASAADGGEAVPLRVVGSGLGPAVDFGGYGDLAAFTRAGHLLVRQADAFTAVHVDLVASAGVADVEPELRGFERSGPQAPSAIANLVELDGIPNLLTGLGLVIALSAVGHVIVLTARHRRRELATVRALGCTHGQARAAVFVAAAVVAGAGMAVGLPVGVAAGGQLWATAATGVSVAADFVAPSMLLAVVPTVLTGALLVAALPAARAVRSLAEALRS